MKRWLTVFALLGVASVLRASETINSTALNAVQSASKNVDVDLNYNKIDAASVQIIYSSASPSTVSFIDGTPSTTSLTVSGISTLTTDYAHGTVTLNATTTQILGTAATNFISISSWSALSGQTITFNGVSILEGRDFAAATSSATTAANLARAMAGMFSGTINVSTFGAFGSIVYATAAVTGTAGNLFTLTSSTPAAATVGGANFAGGVAPIFNGAVLTVNGVPRYAGTNWLVGRTSSDTAVNICNDLNSTFGTIIRSTVTPPGVVIYSTAAATGSAGNAYSFVSSTSPVMSASATFTGGQDNATITIGNFVLTANSNWFPAGSTALTGISIASAINTSALGTVMQAATQPANGAIVTATATFAGAWTNFKLAASSPTALTWAGASGFMTGGTDSNIVSSTYAPLQGVYGYSYVQPNPNTATLSSIVKTQTSWGTALPLLLAKVSGTVPTGLTDKTTYYASNVTSSGFQLSDTSTGAVAGLAISLSTSSNVGNGSFTLTPIAISGTPSFKLQMSNDGTNFQDVYISTAGALTPIGLSVSFASPYTASSILWNLGNLYYRYLRLAYTAATWGATNINYIINGKKFAN